MDGIKYLSAENRKKKWKNFSVTVRRMSRMQSYWKKIPKKTYFIKAGGAANFIYILLSGRVEGIDFVGYGRVFSFREFDEGTVLGDYECLAGINNYTVSLQALEDCWFWVMPADVYLSWLNRDPHALMIRTHDLMHTLVVQTKKEQGQRCWSTAAAG
jgi:CRP-like cAMP-binding protein